MNTADESMNEAVFSPYISNYLSTIMHALDVILETFDITVIWVKSNHRSWLKYKEILTCHHPSIHITMQTYLQITDSMKYCRHVSAWCAHVSSFKTFLHFNVDRDIFKNNNNKKLLCRQNFFCKSMFSKWYMLNCWQNTFQIFDVNCIVKYSSGKN